VTSASRGTVVDDTDRAAARIPELLSQLRATPPPGWPHDPRARRQRTYEALAQHPDPVLREIGRQLVDGTMRPADILRSSVYVEALREAAARAAQRLDPVAIAEKLEELVAAGRSPGGLR
jgi:hypothetical protein